MLSVPMDTLEAGVAVHCFAHREPVAAAEAGRLTSLLGPDERSRGERFHLERARNAFVLAHAFMRLILSRYERVRPDSWRFACGAWGKPQISGPIETSLRFNLSHTRGLVACAVTRDREVGVDVERLEPITEMSMLADRFFSPSEVASLRALRGAEQVRRFYQLWTLKEAYVKARGLGLSLPVNQIAFTVDGDRTTVNLNTVLDDDASSWLFARFSPTSRHQVAVAVRDPTVAVWTVHEETTFSGPSRDGIVADDG